MDEPIEFAIVGGGVAGTYAAWRLATASPRRAVHLFEATSRIGGRLLTGSMPGLPFRAELGGMRYTERQLLVANLIKKLDLSSRPFEFDTCLLFLRGRHMTSAANPPYQLGIGEIGKGPGELILHAIRCALREVVIQHDDKAEVEAIREKLSKLFDPAHPVNVSIFTERQWSFVKRFGELHGAPLHEIGFWNL